MQIGKFIILGCASAVVDIGILIILVEIAGLHYLVSAVISFMCANTLNYAVSRCWVFIPGRHEQIYEYMGFLAASGAGLGMHFLIIFALVNYAEVDYRIAKTVCIGIVAFWNFISRKTLIFSR